MIYKIALHKSDEGIAVSVPGLPGCWYHQVELDAFLSDTDIEVKDIPKECYVEAAKRWQKYNRRRVLGCHHCGHGHELIDIVCNQCGKTVKIRQHILSDFLIGAFALSTNDQCIATNDKGYFKTYFPELKIISCYGAWRWTR